jgi:diaminopimelate decarboxylase
VESEAELEHIDRVAGDLDTTAPVSIRVNPDVDAGSHPYISTGLKENKFGIDIRAAEDVYRRAADMPRLRIAGIDCHIGSQLTELAPFLDALGRVLELADRLERYGIPIEHLDLGGGLGIRYTKEEPPEPADYARAQDRYLEGRHYEVILEPGRAIAGNAGLLLTRVEFLKTSEHRHFAIIDAAMNDLLRPALYQAVQDIVPARRKTDGERAHYDLVGPVCETGDFIGKGRDLILSPGDLLAVRGSGAYGFTMSSNYNSRPRAPEVMVDGAEAHLVRKREEIRDLYAGEALLP